VKIGKENVKILKNFYSNPSKNRKLFQYNKEYRNSNIKLTKPRKFFIKTFHRFIQKIQYKLLYFFFHLT